MERIERKWRDDLPVGPWNDEPDKVQWPDPATGLACMIRRGPFGQWCGYVGVPESHPWFGKDADAVRDYVIIHDGITYADACDGDEEFGICHTGEPDLWWFGFACMTAWDLVPYMAETMKDMMAHMETKFPLAGELPPMTYRDVAYVTEETERLALQIAARADG